MSTAYHSPCFIRRLFIYLLICLPVSNSISRKTTHQNFVKTLPQTHRWTRKSPLNFGSQPYLYPNPAGILARSFSLVSTRKECVLHRVCLTVKRFALAEAPNVLIHSFIHFVVKKKNTL